MKKEQEENIKKGEEKMKIIEEERKKKEEERKRKQEEEEKRKKEEEEKKKKEDEDKRKKLEEERKKKEEEKKMKKEEEEKKKNEEEEKKEEAKRKKIEEEKIKREEEKKKREEEEEKKKKEDEEKKKKEEEEKRKKKDEERKKRDEEKKRRQEEEEKKKKEEEEKKKEERKKKIEEIRKKQEERYSKKKAVLERQEKLRKVQNFNIENEKRPKEEKIKEVLEDMCILGDIMKKEIIEEKSVEPEKFIPIEEATKEENKNNQSFCLGLLAQKLEDIGITTAIERNSSTDEESQNTANTVLQFIMNGNIEKEKYDLHFDFGEERNKELLNNKEEQEKFNNKLRKKLSIEYNIPEDKIIITNPQKGSYEIQVIFETDDFNKLKLEQLKEKCKNDEEFKELSYLKEVHSGLIMGGCKLKENMLESRGNRESGWGVGEKRGGYDYIPPHEGWKGYGLKVWDKYDNGNNDWLAYDGNKNEWAVAYHGIGTKLGSEFTLEKATASIIAGGFKPGNGQAFENNDDDNHPGQKIGKGVYCSPDPKVMEEYASSSESSTSINGKKYMMGFMMRVKPDKIRYSNSQKNYWILDGTTEQMRPYRILIKECN